MKIIIFDLDDTLIAEKKYVQSGFKFVSKKINVQPNNLLLMHQTHSNKVTIINNKNKNSKKFYSDAIITNIKGLALGVVTADCVPILLYDQKNETIACIHAGWKGAFSGIIENTIGKLKKLNSNNKIYSCGFDNNKKIEWEKRGDEYNYNKNSY